MNHEVIKGVNCMKRRNLLKYIGGFTLGSFIPLNLDATTPGKEIDKKIRKINCDILVVGGGTAGVIAALQAARAGCSTILVENGSQLGGTTTTGGVAFPGLFHAWGKQIIRGIGWELITETVDLSDGLLPDFTIPTGTDHPRHQIPINPYIYTLLAEEKCIEAGVHIRYYETPVKAQFIHNNWHVEVMGKGTHVEIISNQVIDCTGNAFLSALAGFGVLREDQVQPGTLMFKIGGYDFNKLDKDMIKKRYADAIAEDRLSRADFRNDIMGLLRSRGDNIQHVLGADSTTSETNTMTNINGRSSLLHTLRFLKTLPGCEKTAIESMQTEVGVRETFRIDGVYQITHDDYIEGRIFTDSLSYSFYPIDIHDEHGVVPRHLRRGVVPTIPLRALIPKKSENFLVAGRCVSSDREANSALRVQASCMGMGQAAGAAAVIANKRKTTPLQVPIDEVKQLISFHDGLIPG